MLEPTNILLENIVPDKDIRLQKSFSILSNVFWDKNSILSRCHSHFRPPNPDDALADGTFFYQSV